jgi:hypothetical protein
LCPRCTTWQDRPVVEAFREPRIRRARRQAVTIARAIRAGRARAKATPFEVAQVDGTALRDLLAGIAAEARLVAVPVNRAPWTPSGVHVTVGEHVTWLAWGAVNLVKPLGIVAPAGPALAVRIGPGPARRSTRDTLPFSADRAGPVELGSVFPAGGELDPDGSVRTDRIPYRAQRGTLAAVVVRWEAGTDPRAALAAVADRDPSGLCAAEAARLADRPQPPSGWEHHPLLPPREVFAASQQGIACDCRQSGAIVQRPADAPLTPTLALRWSWRLDELPSRLPEDTILTHDYMSVALEFDDGQDLTWYWSGALPVGLAYRCPLDHWRHRETHIVARSGSADLGRWVDEERPVLADHQAAIGGPAPARIVHAWLIAVSFFQSSAVHGEFGRIALVDRDRVIRVL